MMVVMVVVMVAVVVEGEEEEEEEEEEEDMDENKQEARERRSRRRKGGFHWYECCRSISTWLCEKMERSERCRNTSQIDGTGCEKIIVSQSNGMVAWSSGQGVTE
jgi:hypothetical protein